MAGKKHYKQINIDVEPFLSIMAIVLKLISLILVVIVMRIAVNKDSKRIINLLPSSSRGGVTSDLAKEPSYIDCFSNSVVLYPLVVTNTWEELQRPDNAVDAMLDKIQAKSKTDYVIVMARPDSVKVFRQVRKMVNERTIDVGYDVVDADFKVDWIAAERRLGVERE